MVASVGFQNATIDLVSFNGFKQSLEVAFTESIVMRSKSGTVRKISSEHDFTRKTGFRFAEE